MYARVFFTAAGLYDESHVACEDLIGEVMTLCGMEDESLGCWNPMASRHDAEEAMETLRHDASGANRWAHSPRRAADALAKLKAHWQFLDETEDGR